MSLELENKYLRILGRAFLTLGFTFLFALLAVFPSIGYTGTFEFTSIERFPRYAIVQFRGNATLNPVLYPASWVFRGGRISGNYTMILPPTAYSGEIPRPKWGGREDTREKAELTVIGGELKANLPMIFLVCLIVEVIGRRILYLSILSGVVGFFMAEAVGTFIGLAAGIFIVVYVEKTENGMIIRRLWERFWSG